MSASINFHLGRSGRDDEQTIEDVVRVEPLRSEIDSDPSHTTYVVKLGEWPSEATLFVEEDDLPGLARIFIDARNKASQRRRANGREAMRLSQA